MGNEKFTYEKMHLAKVISLFSYDYYLVSSVWATDSHLNLREVNNFSQLIFYWKNNLGKQIDKISFSQFLIILSFNKFLLDIYLKKVWLFIKKRVTYPDHSQRLGHFECEKSSGGTGLMSLKF